MATGNFISTTDEASEELYEFGCSVCAENSITKEARTYCKDCAEYLCEECLKHHNKFPRMRSHVITDTSGQASDSRTTMKGSNTDSPKCGVHHGNDLTVFCKQHDEFCCQSCIALKHRSCSRTIEIRQAATDIKNSSEYQTKVTAMSEVLTALQEAKNKIQDNLKNCKSEKENVLENVDEYKRQLYTLIDEISQKTKDRINMKNEDIEIKFGKNISTLETVITSTEQALQNVTSENEVRSFVYMRSCTDVVDGCRELLQEMAQYTDRKPLSFSLNKDILNTFVQHETLLREEVYNASTERSTKILVSNLPSSADEEYLETFFENTMKFGGAPVSDIELDEDNAFAVIEFEDPYAVETVFGKRPIKMMGQEVDVQIYVPEPPPPRCTIEVTGPPDVVCEDQLSLLEMYFENERLSGGGAVIQALFDNDKTMALITFESENVARRVEKKRIHLVKQENIFVKLHTPETKQKTPKKTESEEEGANMQEEQPTCIVKVKGVDKWASRDTLEFYFENEKRSGGRDIDIIKSDDEEEDVLYITYKKQKTSLMFNEARNSGIRMKHPKNSIYRLVPQ